MMKNNAQQVIPNLQPFELELRRGVIVLAAMSRLHRPEYGYSLKRVLAARGLEIDEGTLYPLLRRLEGQGLLVSDWRVEEGRPRRYYEISPAGREAERALRAHWRKLVRTVDGLLDLEGS